ncbi:hypothetical protein [Marinifilum caeruleilacunae]|uniref:Uncharacterized protein n=1 Tax=Marinifilum caeruleilacunae TaxID=2499076 RepID=A0ABX1WR04_9BACT|nr:hypothetical protein [Marinifilum caeruleilacunae]NOU58476.1 hypothetical protein [Marinifilum caeruleilacunae]
MSVEKIKIVLKVWIGFSILALAYSIFHFSSTLLKVNGNIPAIITETSLINEQIDSITNKRIPQILEVIPEVTIQVDNIQSKIPMLISETEKLQNSTIPKIIAETHFIGNMIPSVLERIDSVHKQLPKILETINSTNITMSQTLLRVDSIRQIIPEVISTVNTTNDSVSSYMKQAEILVANADKTANNIGKNASKGFVGGIVSSPLYAVQGLGNFVFGKKSKLSHTDAIVAEEQVVHFLSRNSADTVYKWSSGKISKSGTINIIKAYRKKGKFRKKVKVTFDHYEETIISHFEQGENGQWFFLK